jgi:hypothetical protein
VRSEVLLELRRLADPHLLSRVRDLAAGERGATALLVAHLAELDTRDAHLKAGYGSLFAYCREALALSEQDAYHRVAAARTARRFPALLDRLERGDQTLAALRVLAPHLTAENHAAVLDSSRGKTRLQVEEIAARLAPSPDAPTFVRKLPPPRSAPPAAASLAGPVTTARPAGTTPGPPRPAEVVPTAPDRYKVQVTIGGGTLEKLRFAKDLLRHAVPSGDEAVILDRALTSLLADLAQKKFAATARPKPAAPTAPDSRHVPAEVKRAVWVRDLGRCAFVGAGGRRCVERAFVEFHHVRPYAAGGGATTNNVELRCRSHNGYESRTFFSASRAAPGGPEARGPGPS